jgi:hypothetical protein
MSSGKRESLPSEFSQQGGPLPVTERYYSDTESDQPIAEQSTHWQSTRAKSSHGDKYRAETEEVFSQRIAMESIHGDAVSGWRESQTHIETADGDGVILAAIQLASSGWRGSHATARQREDSEGFWCSPANISCAYKQRGF